MTNICRGTSGLNSRIGPHSNVQWYIDIPTGN